jgi:hypothetical protein
VNELDRLLDAEGRVLRWPSNVVQKTAVLEYLASKFEFDTICTESEVNAILEAWHVFSDWALLRRELCVNGLLVRTANGSRYTRPATSAREPSETMEEKLTGGHMAEVTRVGNRVFRSTGFWSATVHRLLLHLQAKNFEFAPTFIGLERDREVLEFVPGVVPQYPLPEFVLTNESISRAARILRAFHDATSEFAHRPSDRWQVTELIRAPVEVVCHNDFSPYNTVFRDGIPVSMIDFDVAAPGPRVWDLAFAVYRFTHLCGISDGSSLAQTVSRREEIDCFCAAYGCAAFGFDARTVLETIPERLRVLCATMERLAFEGHAGVVRNLEDGHLEFYRREIRAIERFSHDLEA